MIVSTFSELLEEYAHASDNEKNQHSWAFLEQAKKVRTLVKTDVKKTDVDPAQAVKDGDVTKFPGKTFSKVLSGDDVIIGKMVLFQYDAKTKDKLPFWDQFPLIFPIQVYNNGYLGLNLHYLPLNYRANLMDALYTLLIKNQNKLDEKSRLKISYEALNSYAKFRYFRPCVKRYLYNNVKSQWSVIPGDQWDVALFLPLQRFQKASVMINKRAIVYDFLTLPYSQRQTTRQLNAGF